MKAGKGRSHDSPLDVRRLSPPVPHSVAADPDRTLHAVAERCADNLAGDPGDGLAGSGVNGETYVAGHALFPCKGCDLCGLVVTLPKGWSIPGRGLLSDDDLPADFPISAAELRRSVKAVLSGPDSLALFPCMHATAELADTIQAGHYHVTLKFDPTLPAATDGLLHFSFPPECGIDYAPATGKADFRLTLIPPEHANDARILFHSFAAKTPDRQTGIRRRTLLSYGAFLDVPASSCRDNDGTGTARKSLRTEILNGNPPADAGFRVDGAARPRRAPAAGMDFPPLLKGDRVIRLRFRAPDPDRGRISYRGRPVDANADGVVDLGGEDFDPACVSFSPVGHWTGTVRLIFAATVKNFFSKEEREAIGTVCFTVAAPAPTSVRNGVHGDTQDGAHVAIHSRIRPPDKSRAGCSLPEGRGYRKEVSGVTCRQTGISLKGEVANHKEHCDESARVSRLCRPGDSARCVSCLQGGNEEVIRTVPMGGTLRGHFPFAAVLRDKISD
jgi:hypothetical protein